MRSIAMMPLVLLAAGCPGDDDSGDPSTTATLQVTLAVTEGADLLPDDGSASFEVWVAEGLGEHVADGQVAPGGTVSLEVPPGTWDVWATFAWQDPSIEDTGGYSHTECTAHEDGVAVEAGDTVSVTLEAECGLAVTD